MSDDFLDDLEDLVDCDWGEVHQQFKKEEYKKEISEPVIPDFPEFKQFYQILVDLTSEQYLHPRLAELIYRCVRKRGRKTSPAFEHVWQFFANPEKYTTTQGECNSCKANWTVVYKRQRLPRVNMWDGPAAMTVEREVETVKCPSCCNRFLHISGQVVGIFDNRRVIK